LALAGLEWVWAVDLGVKLVVQKMVSPATSRRRIGRFMVVTAFMGQKAAEKL
jgi:hypothetical protein